MLALTLPAGHRATSGDLTNGCRCIYLVQERKWRRFDSGGGNHGRLLLEGKGILLNLSRLLLIPVGLLLYDQSRHRTRLFAWLLVVFSVLCYMVLGRRALIAFALSQLGGGVVILYLLRTGQAERRKTLPIGALIAVIGAGLLALRG